MLKTTRRAAIAVIAAATLALTGCVSGEGSSTATSSELKTLKLDWAYWNPLSLVIKDQGWLEADLAEQGINVEWIQSAGSSKALENLNAEAIDIGSAAGSAVFAARANGAGIKTVGIFSQPNWASLVVGPNSNITSAADLKGKKVAAASGTDPYFFLLRALSEAGLSSTDVEIVNLIHADGQKALESGEVDAWAGLDPLTATSERTFGSKIILSEPSWNSWGLLNTTEKFLANQPAVIEIVLRNYERARQWIAENPQGAADILAREASLDPADATKVLLERTNVAVSLIPGEAQLEVLRQILPILAAEAKIKSAEAGEEALKTLFDDSIARKVVG
jgi:sulfonate transport system substrate-binding protein